MERMAKRSMNRVIDKIIHTFWKSEKDSADKGIVIWERVYTWGRIEYYVTAWIGNAHRSKRSVEQPSVANSKALLKELEEQIENNSYLKDLSKQPRTIPLCK